jgi:hypothetical protein
VWSAAASGGELAAAALTATIPAPDAAPVHRQQQLQVAAAAQAAQAAASHASAAPALAPGPAAGA